MLTTNLYRYKQGKRIKGAGFPAIVNNFDFYLTTLVVYADGMIDCWGLMDLNELKHHLKTGWICINLPPDAELHIPDLGIVKTTEFQSVKSNDDFIREIEDCIIELNGGESRTKKCIRLFRQYLLTGSEDSLKELKIVFYGLSPHRRLIFEPAQEKDPLFMLMTNEVPLSAAERKSIIINFSEELA